MKEGIKLYNQFKQLISTTGEIKMAWFTTFNFSVSFFEKYILSALVQTSSQDLRSLKDFEALNDRIVNAENGGIDIRVFHDYRAMRPDVKKTSIQTFAIDPKELDERYAHGVFHPKVGLIVNDKNDAWIITGSANLTISAWSANSEGVVFKKIEDKVNAQRITDFFMRLMPPSESEGSIGVLNKLWQKTLKSEISDWEFFNSFSNKSVLDKLDLNADKKLHVWSPYFSDDLIEIIDNQLSAVEEISIIPDRTSANTIRISKEGLKSLQAHKKIQLLEDYNLTSAEEVLAHAKIWLTETKLAVGSWNFTKAGLNLSSNANNVEAGIIINIETLQHISFLKSCNLKYFEAPEGMSTEILENDRKQLLSDWKMTCQIYADWSTYTYRLETEENLEEKEFYVQLPGYKDLLNLRDLEKFGASFYNNHKSLLKDRLFNVYDAPIEGQKIFMGVIVELNPKERPAIGFDSINDLLRAWTDKKPESKTQYHEANYEDDEETGEELSVQIINALKGGYSNAWFTMFLAFEQMKLRIEESKDNWRELKMIGYNLPGSVSQLSNHLLRLRQKTETEELEMSSSFVWFMINEGNNIIRKFNSLRVRDDSPEIALIDNIQLEFKDVGQPQLEEWLNYIKNKCEYVKA